MFDKIKFLSGWENAMDAYFCPMHDHSCFEIVHHPSGTGHTEIDSWGCLDFSPGYTVVYPPKHAHTQTLIDTGVDMVIHFFVEACPDVLQSPLIIETGENLYNDLAILVSPAVNRTALQQQALDFRLGAVVCRLLEMYVLDSGNTDGSNRNASYAQIAYSLIREKYATIQKLGEIAEEIGISYDYLRHVFREHYSTSLQDALISARLDRARELLRHSSLPLKSIARMCGFGSDRHMCNVFNKRLNSSPAKLRNSH